MLQRALERLAEVESDRNLAPSQLAELLAFRRLERERAIRSEARFHSYSLATLLLERSEQEVSRSPGMAWELARLGHSIVWQIDPRTCGGDEALTDFKAYALAVEGNSLRVCGDFRASLRVFASSRLVQRQGGVDPALTAMIDLLESSLRRDLWQLDSAVALLHRAAEAFAYLDDQDRVTRTILGRANISIVRGDWPNAVAILRGALDWTSDFRLTLIARHNLADALVKAGRASEAAQVFSDTRELYDRCTDTLTLTRRRWLEGLIARELGDIPHANDLLEIATDSFRANGYAGDAALAHLDLMVTRRKQSTSRRRKAPLVG